MKFKLDENFGTRTQQLFQTQGHDVMTVREGHPSGLRSLVKLFVHDPFRLLADQKIFGSMPCPGVRTSLMVVNQPQDGSRYGQ